MDDNGLSGEFKVVVNGEGQYAIWPADKATPDGWRDEAVRGAREACLAYIEEVWTDMRPMSLRRSMDREP